MAGYHFHHVWNAFVGNFHIISSNHFAQRVGGGGALINYLEELLPQVCLYICLIRGVEISQSSTPSTIFPDVLGLLGAVLQFMGVTTSL